MSLPEYKRYLKEVKAYADIRREEANVIALAEEMSKEKGLNIRKLMKFRADQNRVSQICA